MQEEVARLGGETEMFLHLRIKDEAPGVLYRSLGFGVAKEDSPFMFLLGSDQRQLMRKAL